MIDVKNYTQEKDERDRKIINNQITKKTNTSNNLTKV